MDSEKLLQQLAVRVRELEARLQDLPVLIFNSGNPDGVVTARESTLCWDITNHRLYVNISNVEGTSWVNLEGGISSLTDPYLVYASGGVLVTAPAWSDGNTIWLDPVVYDDQQVDIGNVRLGSSAPNWTTYKGAQVLAFNPAQDNSVSFNLQLTHAYKLNTNVNFHVHVTVPDNNSGDVRWQLTVSMVEVNGTFPAPTTYTATQTIAANSQDKHLVFSISDNIGSFGAISPVGILTLTRLGTDAADTYANDVYLTALDAHIAKDTVGSRQMWIK